MSDWVVELPQDVRVKASQQFEDLELTRRSQAGGADAFGELVTKYRAKIFTMVYGMVRSEHDAWDLAQETFLKAWQSIHRFERRSSFYTWLYSIMVNLTIYSLRRKSRREEAELNDAIPSLLPDRGVNYDLGEIRRLLLSKSVPTITLGAGSETGLCQICLATDQADNEGSVATS